MYTVFGLVPGSRLGGAVQFFIEDTTKIFFLLVVMIYCIALIRASMNVERIRDYLAGKNRSIGYFMRSTFGAITPFCSCSSIPVFLGFISAGIPVGITMSFLLTSPLINEVAVLLLMSLVGWKINPDLCNGGHGSWNCGRDLSQPHSCRKNAATLCPEGRSNGQTPRQAGDR